MTTGSHTASEFKREIVSLSLSCHVHKQSVSWGPIVLMTSSNEKHACTNSLCSTRGPDCRYQLSIKQQASHSDPSAVCTSSRSRRALSSAIYFLTIQNQTQLSLITSCNVLAGSSFAGLSFADSSSIPALSQLMKIHVFLRLDLNGSHHACQYGGAILNSVSHGTSYC